MADDRLTYVIYVACSTQRLWEALTSADALRQNWGRIESGWTVGSAVTEVDDKGHVLWKGKVVRSDPPRRLAYTFEVEGTEDPDTTVAFEIGLPVSPLADGAEVVRLELTQTGFTQGSALREDCARAWAEILSSIKTFVETGRPLGFAWKH